MKRPILLLLPLLLICSNAGASSAMAQDENNATGKNKMAFVVAGPEDSYNQIRVINNTSLADFQCRVVFLNEDNTVKELYGIYNLKESNDSDSNTSRVKKGQRMGIQMPNDFPKEVTFTIEYKDYPLFDAILIHINEQSSTYDDAF